MSGINRRTAFAAFAGIAAAMTLGVTSAHADQYETIMASKKLRVGTDVAFPPFGFLDADLKPTGSDVEVAKALAADWGLELEFVTTVSSTRVPNLTSDRADIIISSLTKTPERAEAIDFTKPYSVIQAVVGGVKSVELKSLEDFKGKVISLTRGGVPERNLAPEEAKIGFTIRRYDDDATLVTAGVVGQAEIVAASGNIIHEITSRNQQFEVKFVQSSYDLRFGIRKGEPGLEAKLNEWIATNLANGRLNEMYKKYHFKDLPEDLASR